MPIKVLMNDVANDMRTIGIEATGWPRIVIILNQEDGVHIQEHPEEPLKLTFTRKPGANKTNG